tara:strand:+ start:35 stop:847 length:813 start_codon:yes stop_codon:yes gene_type:complete
MCSDLVVIVDADTPIQRIGFLDLKDYTEYERASDANMIHVVAGATKYAAQEFGLSGICEADVHLHFTGAQRPRMRNKYDQYEIYKEGRSKKGKKGPVFVGEMTSDLYEKHNHEWTFHIADATEKEADDTVVSHAYECLSLGIPYVIVGVDKDLKQAAGLHYNFVKKSGEFISKLEADLFIYYQLLVGDAADSIGGVLGIGPVKAKQLLGKCTSASRAHEIVEEIYHDRYHDDEIFYSDWFGLFMERANKLYMHRSTVDEYQHPTKDKEVV